jgi:hypothetical protein
MRQWISNLCFFWRVGMKSLSALVAAVACASAPVVSARDAAVEAPIEPMIDRFNNGDSGL